MPPLGLVAGEGVFPLLVARGAKAAGRKVICVGLRGSASPDLANEVDRFDWVGVAQLRKWFRSLHRFGCTQAIMVGRVKKAQLHDPRSAFANVPDFRAIWMWLTVFRKDQRPQTVLTAMSDMFAKESVPLSDSTEYVRDHMATPGVMTRRQPTAAQWEDIHHGWEQCSTLCRLDIGQSLAILRRDVIAVEAIEGTNAMIERAGSLCRPGGWVCIKVANLNQDMRLDVPTVGTTTIEKLAAARAACLVLEPGKTILLEKPKVLELADKLGISVVGYEKSN